MGSCNHFAQLDDYLIFFPKKSLHPNYTTVYICNMFANVSYLT